MSLLQAPEGQEKAYEANYPKLTNYLKNGIAELLKNSDIRDGLKVIGGFSDAQINELATYGKGGGIEITVSQLYDGKEPNQVNGYTPAVTQPKISIDIDLVKQLENASPADQRAALLGVISTILHETTHVGEGSNSYGDPFVNKSDGSFKSGNFERRFEVKTEKNRSQSLVWNYYFKGELKGNASETGQAFESSIYGTKVSDDKQGTSGIKDQNEIIKRTTEKEDKSKSKSSVIPKL